MATADPATLEQTEERVTTVIAEDVDIRGSLEFKTSLMIKGPLEGEIISEGFLVVGPVAKIKATILTERLVSNGEIQGDATASAQVVMKEPPPIRERSRPRILPWRAALSLTVSG